MTSLDLKEYVHLDLYKILKIDALSDQKDIDRAFRKLALAHHPDKTTDNKDFHAKIYYEGNVAKDVLSDPDAKRKYDEARSARERERQRNELLNAHQRKLKEDLLKRENAGKRSYNDTADEDEQHQEFLRIQADGRRRVAERREQLRQERERKREEKAKAKAAQQPQPPQQQQQETKPVDSVKENPKSSQGISDADRSIRARFKRNANTQTFDVDRIKEIFSVFGPVEYAFLMSDKKEKMLDSKTKMEVGRCGLVFKSILGAYEAVEEWQSKADNIWEEFLGVAWGGGEEPVCIANIESGQPSTGLTDEEYVMLRFKKAAKKRATEQTDNN